ncbi:MAG: aminopeptidase P family protein [Euryarchaeota archaeon]|nr:aminopeptidase P family protein [Euryarchaeota archaeon]
MKLSKILDDMYKENIDSMLVLKPENITYLSGFRSSSYSILILKDEPVLFIPKMDLDEAMKDSKIQVEELKSFDKIKESLSGNVGIENSLNVETFKRIQNDFEIINSDIIERSRSIKSENEVKNIQKAVNIAEASIKDVELVGKECEVAAEIEYNMRMNGSSKSAFDTIVASGPRSSLPHSKISRKTLEDPIMIDWGAIYNNYCSDMTRTFIKTEKQEELLDIVIQAQKRAIDVIKPGIKASYVDKVVREVFEEFGYEKSFIHSTGHGIGLEAHESPSLSKKEKTKLQKGMVITLEPGIYLKGKFGVRIEDIVLIKNKAKVLNKTQRKLRLL